MSTEKRIQTLEAEAAFQGLADVMGGWDSLRAWAYNNQSHLKEILLRFVPEQVFKQHAGLTLEELIVGSGQEDRG